MFSFGQFANQMSYLIWTYKRRSQAGEELPFPHLQQVLDMSALVGKEEIIKGVEGNSFTDTSF